MINSVRILLVLLVGFMLSCAKSDSSPEITYPPTYNSSLNLLSDSAFVVKPGIKYALAVSLPKGTSIKIVSKPTDGITWAAIGFLLEQKTGFRYQDNYPESMVFEAEGGGSVVNVPVVFGERESVQSTSIDFYVYENTSDTVSRLKTVRTFNVQ